MSAETLDWLAENSLIGFTSQRGNAWHWREGNDNHFEGAIPRDRVLQLLSYPLAEGAVSATVIGDDGVLTVEAPDRKAIVRTDTQQVLGIFKQGYKIHQPAEWCLSNLELLLDGGLEIGSAIVLKGGAVAAVQAELPETRVAAGGRGAEPVLHRPHITAATSHDGSMATTYLTGTKIWVCDNTLSMAMAESSALKHKIRHSSQSLSRIYEVRNNLGLIVEQVGDEFDQMVRELTERYVSDAKFTEVVKAYTGVDKAKEGRSKTIAENKVQALNNMWYNDDRVAPWRNSAWGVLAAFNTADHHVFGADKTRLERNEQRALSGDRQKFDGNVLRLLETV